MRSIGFLLGEEHDCCQCKTNIGNICGHSALWRRSHKTAAAWSGLRNGGHRWQWWTNNICNSQGWVIDYIWPSFRICHIQ
ncbi:hypothetical protein CICLE_v10010075mg [Citrus x clementina]|uniref:Uncharacterized protein n=1 Tax=Citrus clementina TaxID=85681 RepID=V4WJD5_CITCL|nr:hypothetical protein CICLE_v10010075mg [Citrus x clementina]